MRKKLRKASP